MSRTKPREAETAQIVYDCDQCGALAWQWCVARSGRWAPFLHSNRFYSWRRAVSGVAGNPEGAGEKRMSSDGEVRLLTTWQPVPLDKFGQLRDLLTLLAAPFDAAVISLREPGDGSVEYFIDPRDFSAGGTQ